MPSRRALLSVAACLGLLALPSASAAQETIKVVATFSILGDLAKNVGGDRIDLATLVGPDGDAHVYSPTPADARRVAEARVVIANGLKLDGWVDRLAKSSGTKAKVVEAANGIPPLKREAGLQDGGHRHETVDPHGWQSVANAKVYVANIRDALVDTDPAGADAYRAGAAAYLARLDALEAEVRAAIDRIPAERRTIITSHEALGYFGAAYGLRIVAPQGVSTDAEASAKDVARIIRQIKREKIAAVFLDNVSDPRLIERIANESGARIGGRLYSDALSVPDGPAATYIDMMRHNMRALSAALSS